MWMLLESFDESLANNLYAEDTQEISNTLRSMDRNSCQSILIYLGCTKYDEKKIHFVKLKNIEPLNYDINTVLVYRSTQKNSDIQLAAKLF